MPQFFYNCSSPQEVPPVEVNCSWSEIGALNTFQLEYNRVHKYVSAVVCALGVLSNILIIIVLTRKTMISPTNLLLTGDAILLVIVSSTL